MIKKYVMIFIVVLAVSAGAGWVFFGCAFEEEISHDPAPCEEEDYIVIGLSQIGSESDWRNANTESFKSVFTAGNGYYLLYEDAQQKQENQLKGFYSPGSGLYHPGSHCGDWVGYGSHGGSGCGNSRDFSGPPDIVGKR